MLALLATLKPFLEKVLFELEAFLTWKRTKYLGLKANKERIGQGHTGKVYSICTHSPMFFPTLVTGVQRKEQKENGMPFPEWEISLTQGHPEKGNPLSGQFPFPLFR
jgi:hypothetical protein